MSDSSGRRGGGFGCGGCLLVLLVLGIYACQGDRIRNWWQERSEQKEQEAKLEEQSAARERLEAELATWTRDNAPELQAALEDLEGLRERERARLRKLEDTLVALGREPETDDDWVRARQRIGDVALEIDRLRQAREEAYLSWQKFLIDRDPREEALFRDAVETGRGAAEQARERMSTLLDRNREDGR